MKNKLIHLIGELKEIFSNYVIPIIIGYILFILGAYLGSIKYLDEIWFYLLLGILILCIIIAILLLIIVVFLTWTKEDKKTLFKNQYICPSIIRNLLISDLTYLLVFISIPYAKQIPGLSIIKDSINKVGIIYSLEWGLIFLSTSIILMLTFEIGFVLGENFNK